MLNDLRKHLGITQKELAKELGCSLSLLSKIESGERNPSFNFIKKVQKKYPGYDIRNFF